MKLHIPIKDEIDNKILEVVGNLQGDNVSNILFQFEKYKIDGSFHPKSEIVRTMMRVYGSVGPHRFHDLAYRLYRLKGLLFS
jgi:hypothetical protein